MNKIPFLSIFVTTTIIIFTLLIGNSSATVFKDSNDYTPKWAKSQDDATTLKYCAIISSSDPMGSDAKWCTKFSAYANKKISPKVNLDNNEKTKIETNKKITSQKTITKNTHPKMFLVYANNLDSSYTLVNSEIDRSQLKNDGEVHSAVNSFSSKKGTMYSTSIEFDNKKNALKVVDDFGPVTHTDKLVFSISKDEKCQISGTKLIFFTCIVGKYSLSIFGVEQNQDDNEPYKLMDMMLKKYYKSQGKEFKQSTKELVKNAVEIPKRERTYEEIVNSLVQVKVISCSDKYSFVNWKGSVTSLATEPIDVFVTLIGENHAGEIITFTEEIILDLYPGQTEYVDRLLDDVSGFDTCSYRIERIIPSN